MTHYKTLEMNFFKGKCYKTYASKVDFISSGVSMASIIFSGTLPSIMDLSMRFLIFGRVMSRQSFGRQVEMESREHNLMGLIFVTFTISSLVTDLKRSSTSFLLSGGVALSCRLVIGASSASEPFSRKSGKIYGREFELSLIIVVQSLDSYIYKPVGHLELPFS